MAAERDCAADVLLAKELGYRLRDGEPGDTTYLRLQHDEADAVRLPRFCLDALVQHLDHTFIFSTVYSMMVATPSTTKNLVLLVVPLTAGNAAVAARRWNGRGLCSGAGTALAGREVGRGSLAQPLGRAQTKSVQF